MKVILSHGAKKQLKKLSKIDQIAIVRKVRLLSGKIKDQKIKGYKNIYRVRVGNFRVVYKKTKVEIFIVLIRHRKDVYRLMKRLFD